MPQVGRNDPCPCGSGKKYKHCCMAKDERQHPALRVLRSTRSAPGHVAGADLRDQVANAVWEADLLPLPAGFADDLVQSS